MRILAPIIATALAGCAARTPLDLIPPQDLVMIEAAERMEAQSPETLRSPQPEPDLAAQYRAALVEAGIAPDAAQAPDTNAADDLPVLPAPPPARPVPAGEAAATPLQAQPDPAQPVPAQPVPVVPAPSGAISVQEMLSRVRAQTGAQP